MSEQSHYPSLNGRCYVVTGATSGIGEATARALIDQGARVVALGRNAEALSRLAEYGCETHPLDITDSAQLEQMIGGLGVVDGLINSAGITHVESALTLPAERIDAVFQANARAAAIAARCVARHMIEAGRAGSIVNVSSQASLVGLDAHLAYSASKAAMDAITRALCLELGPAGIRVNSVNPTVTMTPMAEKVWSAPEKREPMLAAIPLGRFAEMADVVTPILFLLSDEAGMISGVCLPIDGGYTAR
ncbi:SDR family oxidoreductase [Kushneria phosphatilytica]|uniref:SDR family oxidoreductase n=1 Tax=Kushneria phosphatilytica TaxID=657387 RepID=A0A1S1NT06_9GAMM|nr:SDR family oxidoreductase [Kushneria phosphatilytica]OHV08474.1 short-chain dehydrogenase [Kushneria phosphatilytica]QEL09911.1 SDR family oxidoreductase [Kushneria phosphatilytica]